jgi:hypothetical protein
MPQPVVVVDYDPTWPEVFGLQALVWGVVQDRARANGFWPCWPKQVVRPIAWPPFEARTGPKK